MQKSLINVQNFINQGSTINPKNRCSFLGRIKFLINGCKVNLATIYRFIGYYSVRLLKVKMGVCCNATTSLWINVLIVDRQHRKLFLSVF